MQRPLAARITEMNRKSGEVETVDAPVETSGSFDQSPVARPAGNAPVPGALSGFWNGKTRAFGYAGAAFAALLLAIAFFIPAPKPASFEKAQSRAAAHTAGILPVESKMKAVAELAQPSAAPNRFAPIPAATPPNEQSPMIARTVSLTVLVKDFGASRLALDRILAQVHGYPASLTVNTPEDGGRSLQASLRIPAADLLPAMGSLRTLGHVLSETQSGEEVTQQHADLVARLQNSREEETRLRAILEQRTGKIEDVLQVEEAIARVRGEIESMEAGQKSLEHRVDFATVDLQLTEQYTEQLNPAAESASTRLYNAFVAGLRNASGTVLGIVLFLEEFGPAILVWMVILGLPSVFFWRRYRRTRTDI